MKKEKALSEKGFGIRLLWGWIWGVLFVIMSKNGKGVNMGYKYTRGEKYSSRNQDRIDELTEQYAGRKFSYDAETDEAYRAYADMMTANGKKAMEDTATRASAMTGGYGNSYATVAGQQTYNGYLSEIGAAEGDFYNRALSRYNAEGDELLNKINALESRESSDRADWENAYMEDVNSAAAKGDDSTLAKIYEMTDDEYRTYSDNQYAATLAAPTQDILDSAAREYLKKGYFESDMSETDLIENITSKYVSMGYSPDAIAQHLTQQRERYEYVKDRDWTYVSGSGKAAMYMDQFGNKFFYDEIENWVKSQAESGDYNAEAEWKVMNNKLKAIKKSSRN